jgi:lysyl-tRNA synthetase class 1
MLYLRKFAEESNAWPFQEAKKILKMINNQVPKKGFVLFETGYGPSGLPHIGTFGEVVRTTMVRKAFQLLSDIPTRLICFSDDMDGMRKIPDTIPNKDEYKQYTDLPLTTIPDPFGAHESFGHHMNARLRAFLDKFEFEYEFFSATECYKNGMFNDYLNKVIDHYDEIMDVMLPTLGEERRKTYSPILPLDPDTGKVLQVPMLEVDKQNHTVTFETPSGKKITTEIGNGKCKLQWKPDFGMRWAALDVDFETYGKDHLVNGPIYSKICKIIGGKAPHQFFYELFLDEKGEKISKSKGNGLTIDEWLRYAPKESLAYYMYLSPQRAKKLYFDVIPKSVDEYIQHWKAYEGLEDEKKVDSPLFHIHFGHPPEAEQLISYALLLNLVSACNSEDENVIWGYIRHILPDSNAENSPFLAGLVEKAINYYHDFIKPNKKYRDATDKEKQALAKLAEVLSKLEVKTPAEEIQNSVYAIGKEFEFELKDWFKALYEILLGAEQGPRFGSFVALYGIDETIELIKSKI